MQCPNCYTETSTSLSRCPRCNAPLYRQPPAETPGYDSAHEARRDGGYHGEQDASFGNGGNGGNGGTGGYANGGYDAAGLSGGPEDQWEPSPQWAPDWRPEDAPERPLGHRSEPWREAPPRKSGHPFLVAMIAGVVIGGVVAGVILLWPGGDQAGTTPNSSAAASAGASDDGSSGSSGSPAEAHDQAVAINGLLDEMAASRSALGPAITEAAQCDGIDGALPQLDRVKEERQDQLNKAKELKVDALPDGAALRDSLVQAAGHSLDADEAFLTWATTNEGCLEDETPRDDDFKEGQRLSNDRASPGKEDFVDLWNPVAEEQGLPTRSPEKF